MNESKVVDVNIYLDDSLVALSQCLDQLNLANPNIHLKKHSIDPLNFLLNPNPCQSHLCVVFVSNDKNSFGISGFNLAHRILSLNHHLLIFVSCSHKAEAQALQAKNHFNSMTIYSHDNLVEVESVLMQRIYANQYPGPIINTIKAIGQKSISQHFKNISVQAMTPYLITDFNTFDQYLGLLPIDIPSGRGYLLASMLKSDLEVLVQDEHTSLNRKSSTHEYNDFIGEIVNLVWGQIRAQLSDQYYQPDKLHEPHIPIVFNPVNHSISFGVIQPQLCFSYVLKDEDKGYIRGVIQLKTIFNIRWSPEKTPAFFKDNIDVNLSEGRVDIF